MKNIFGLLVLVTASAAAAAAPAGVNCRETGQLLSIQPTAEGGYHFELGDEGRLRTESLAELRRAHPEQSDALLKRFVYRTIGACEELVSCELGELGSPILALCHGSPSPGTITELKVENVDGKYLATCEAKTDRETKNHVPFFGESGVTSYSHEVSHVKYTYIGQTFAMGSCEAFFLK